MDPGKEFGQSLHRLSFYVCEREGKVIAAALNAPERRMLLSNASQESAVFMGTEMAKRGTRLRGVLGPAEAVRAFREGFNGSPPNSATSDGHRIEPRFTQKILRLEALLPHSPTSGMMRVAKEKDFKLLLKWSRQFVTECRLDEKAEETETVVRRYLESRQLFVWEDQRVVAMAGYGGHTPNGVRVNMVYTDPSTRGRGYAGSLVHVLSRRLLADGHRYCFLFTDAENPIANRVYEKLGYRPVGTFTEYCRKHLENQG